MKLSLQRKTDLPLYRQVAGQLREYIRSGSLPPGSQLPTVRQLAIEQGLTRLTVHTAYTELQAEGLVESVVGRGTFVANRPSLPTPVKVRSGATPTGQPQIPWYSQSLLADMLRMSEQPDLISFGQASPAKETFPLVEFRRLMSRVLNDSSALGYGPTQGELSLREELAHLLLDRGIATSPDQILITSGAQQGVDLALRTFSRSDQVLLAPQPTYPGILELAIQRNQPVIGLDWDEHGLDFEAFERACKTYQPSLLYVIPTFNNPTGFCLSQSDRRELLRLAELYNFLIIEDDVYGFVTHGQSAPAALKELDETGNRVIYLTSFSKSLMPGLRLGGIVASEDHLLKLMAAKRATDLICSSLTQRCLADYLRRYQFGVHLQTIGRLYGERCQVVLNALERHLPGCEWVAPQGGLSIWVKLPAGIDERAFYLEAIANGIGVTPGLAFFVQPQRQPYIRLSFGALSPTEIERGVAILGRLVREQLARQTRLLARAGRTSNPLI